MAITHRQELETEAAQTGMEFVKKSYNLTSDELTVQGGDVVAVVSSDTPDDEGEVVIPKNIDLERFRKVRQVYFDHELEQHPIGSAKWIKVDGGKLISKHFFSQTTELGRAVGDLVKEGIYKSYSIGCMKKTRTLGKPTADELKARPEWAGKNIWRGNPLMIEYSVVGQAANPDCVALAVSKKWTKPTVDLLTGITSNTKSTAAAIVKSLTAGGMDDVTATDMAQAADKCHSAKWACHSFIETFCARPEMAAAILAVSAFASAAGLCAAYLSKGTPNAIDQCALTVAAAQQAIPLITAAIPFLSGDSSADSTARSCALAVTAAAECCDNCLPDDDASDKSLNKSATGKSLILSESDVRLTIARGIDQATKRINPDAVIATVLKSMRH